jgi:predicted Rossmann fold nucleotide-binding protein DprA/Smf involved in DNA uptake
VSQRSADEDVVLLASTGLAHSHDRRHKPLGPKGWASLRTHLEDAGLAPGELLAMSAADLESRLSITPERAEQLEGLFARRGQLAFEVERLERLGIWYLTLDMDDYPDGLQTRLGDAAPPVLFGLGDRGLLGTAGLAVVGSRDAPADAMQLARDAGRQASSQGWATVSGAARGVDQASMRGAFETGGPVVGVTADGLEKHLRDATLRTALAGGVAVYVTPYHPEASFSVGAAMGRNKLIYGFAEVGLVVHTAEGSGGTWSGAVEALEARWLPLYVATSDAGAGAAALEARGARSLPDAGLADLAALAAVKPVSEAAELDTSPETTQQTLF